jgi:acetoin utilization deacetylase AcuC-like enzyme
VDKIECNQAAALADVLRVHDYGYLRNLTDFCLNLEKPSEDQTCGIDIDVFDLGDTNVSHHTTLASLHAAGTVIEAVDRFLLFLVFSTPSN